MDNQPLISLRFQGTGILHAFLSRIAAKGKNHKDRSQERQGWTSASGISRPPLDFAPKGESDCGGYVLFDFMLLLNKCQSTECSVTERAKLYALGLGSWPWMSHLAHWGLSWKMHWGKTKISDLGKTSGVRDLFYPLGCSVPRCHEGSGQAQAQEPACLGLDPSASFNSPHDLGNFLHLSHQQQYLSHFSKLYFYKVTKKTMSEHY